MPVNIQPDPRYVPEKTLETPRMVEATQYFADQVIQKYGLAPNQVINPWNIQLSDPELVSERDRIMKEFDQRTGAAGHQGQVRNIILNTAVVSPGFEPVRHYEKHFLIMPVRLNGSFEIFAVDVQGNIFRISTYTFNDSRYPGLLGAIDGITIDIDSVPDKKGEFTKLTDLPLAHRNVRKRKLLIHTDSVTDREIIHNKIEPAVPQIKSDPVRAGEADNYAYQRLVQDDGGLKKGSRIYSYIETGIYQDTKARDTASAFKEARRDFIEQYATQRLLTQIDENNVAKQLEIYVNVFENLVLNSPLAHNDRQLEQYADQFGLPTIEVLLLTNRELSGLLRRNSQPTQEMRNVITTRRDLMRRVDSTITSELDIYSDDLPLFDSETLKGLRKRVIQNSFQLNFLTAAEVSHWKGFIAQKKSGLRRGRP